MTPIGIVILVIVTLVFGAVTIGILFIGVAFSAAALRTIGQDLVRAFRRIPRAWRAHRREREQARADRHAFDLIAKGKGGAI